MKVRTILLVPVFVAAALYVGLCGYLFAEQRHAIYQPRPTVLDDAPAGSGYETLKVSVPGTGVLTHWWMQPARSGMPTVIFFHGNGGDRRDFLEQGEALHRLGFGAVLASYPGYSGNPGTPSEAALMADARATIAAVALRTGPIIVWGHSLGSGVAARMAAEGRAAGLVLEAPYTSLPDVAAGAYPYIPVHWLMLDRFDTRALVSAIKVPVLIFHSVDDPQIPFAMGRDLADALGNRATLVWLEGLGHYPHSIDLSDSFARWMQDRCITPCRPAVTKARGT